MLDISGCRQVYLKNFENTFLRQKRFYQIQLSIFFFMVVCLENSLRSLMYSIVQYAYTVKAFTVIAHARILTFDLHITFASLHVILIEIIADIHDSQNRLQWPNRVTAWVINQPQIKQANVSVSTDLHISFFSASCIKTIQERDTSRTWDRLPVESDALRALWHVFSHHPFHITAYLGSSVQITDARTGTLTTTDTS